VQLHAAEVPELPPHLVEPVRRVALEHDMNRSLVVGDPQLAVRFERDLADDDDGAAVIEAGVGDQRREVGGAPRRQLRIGEGAERQRETCEARRPTQNTRTPCGHITFFCAAFARTAPRARNSRPPAIMPSVPSWIAGMMPVTP